jgi:hypothetical protein
MNDSLDDLAAFLMHRSADGDRTDADRLAIYAVVAAYQESYDPTQVETLLRAAGAHFADHRDYRPEWALSDADAARVAPVLKHLAACADESAAASGTGTPPPGAGPPR